MALDTEKTEKIINGIAVLVQRKNILVTVKQSANGALICAVGCFIGGLVGGPAGMAIGSFVAGVSVWKMSEGQFKSVGDVLKKDLTEPQKDELIKYLQTTVRNLNWTNADDLLSLLMDSLSDQEAVISSVVKFLEEQLNLHLPN